MKKICLLSIASFFSVIAFCQNAATVQTVPGQPKPGRANAGLVDVAPTFANASGVTSRTVNSTNPLKPKTVVTSTQEFSKKALSPKPSSNGKTQKAVY